ncbi:MAG: matrixin family metalloprotease [Angustibacter sp.]
MSPRDRVLLVVAVVVAGALTVGARTALATWAGSPAQASGYPPLPKDAQHVRVDQLVQTHLTGPHAFMHLDAHGVPVRYDPCRPIHYVVNPAGGPPGAADLVRGAVGAISAATGLAFVDDGTTSEPVSEHRRPVQRERYGNRWAPVLVGFAQRGTFEGLTGQVAGLGGSYELTTPAGARLVSGQITLASDTFDELVASGRAGQATTIVQHELGHVVGLDHVDDPGQLMYRSNKGQVNLGPGDVEGLAIAGAGPCFRDT